jgi:hypothetical protein
MDRSGPNAYAMKCRVITALYCRGLSRQKAPPAGDDVHKVPMDWMPTYSPRLTRLR